MSKINKRIIELLKDFGDDLDRKREVTHWFYFKKLENLEKFERYTYDIGFQTLTKPASDETQKDKLLLIICRNESINEDQINFDTSDFYKIVERFNGVYDGWETSIEFDSDE